MHTDVLISLKGSKSLAKCGLRDYCFTRDLGSRGAHFGARGPHIAPTPVPGHVRH